jgi:predicted dehydrogenase
MKSLVIGMGIGELYKSVLTSLNFEVVTVDTSLDKNADFTSVEDALKFHGNFDTVNICTPNFTHKEITEQVAPYSKIVFVEKPGFKNSLEWKTVTDNFPNTRIMMVKNNMWRDNILKMKSFAALGQIVNINWIRKNCIPNPGSWFTTRELAYGGVSRDLMPHLLSLYIAMNPEWFTTPMANRSSKQQWSLPEIDSTDYGIINHQGTYDVDDYSMLTYGDKWCLEANWRDLTKEESCVIFNDSVVIELGWCPESAYYNMIKDAVDNKDNDEFWQQQIKQDIWIHEQIENL